MLLLFAIAAFITFVFLIRGLSSPDPQVVKRHYKTTMIILAIVLIPILLKIGKPLIAAVIGIILAAGPYMSRLLQLAYTLKLFRQLFDKKQNKPEAPRPDIGMTISKAREVLGVSSTASKTEIEEAYKNLMKRNHPDAGGSAFIAKQLNQAKDILLKN